MTPMWKSARASIVMGALASMGASGCDDATGPRDVTSEDILRTYNAVLLTTTTSGITTNHLAAGALLTLTLLADGTTIGRVFIPGVDEGGGDFDQSLAGVFTFDDQTDEVVLDHEADTFLRDMTFLATASESGVQLEGEETFAGTLVRVVLR